MLLNYVYGIQWKMFMIAVFHCSLSKVSFLSIVIVPKNQQLSGDLNKYLVLKSKQDK